LAFFFTIDTYYLPTVLERATVLDYMFNECLGRRKYLNTNAITLKTERYTHRRLSFDAFPCST